MEYVKMEIFIPRTHLPALQKALQVVDAGHIGNYDSCLAYSPVMGTWRTLAGADPYEGEVGEITEAEELKVEVRVEERRIDETMRAIRKIHPYETPVVFVLPLLDGTAFDE